MSDSEFINEMERWLSDIALTAAAFAGIDARLRDVVVARFGLDRGTMRTVAETAARYNLSSQRICQLLDRAFAELIEITAADLSTDTAVERAGMVATARIVELIDRVGYWPSTSSEISARELAAVRAALGLPTGPAPEIAAAAAQLDVTPAELITLLNSFYEKFRDT